jgi:hypothetical protein
MCQDEKHLTLAKMQVAKDGDRQLSILVELDAGVVWNIASRLHVKSRCGVDEGKDCGRYKAFHLDIRNGGIVKLSEGQASYAKEVEDVEGNAAGAKT